MLNCECRMGDMRLSKFGTRPSQFQGVAEPFEPEARFVCFFLNADRVGRVAGDFEIECSVHGVIDPDGEGTNWKPCRKVMALS